MRRAVGKAGVERPGLKEQEGPDWAAAAKRESVPWLMSPTRQLE